LLREDNVEFGGAQRACWVVEVPTRFPAGGIILERSPVTYWIDKGTNVVLKTADWVQIKPPNNGYSSETDHDNHLQGRSDQRGCSRRPAPFSTPANASEVGEFTMPFGGGSNLFLIDREGKREGAVCRLEQRAGPPRGTEKDRTVMHHREGCAPANARRYDRENSRGVGLYRTWSENSAPTCASSF
jgi:hypothetical protein